MIDYRPVLLIVGIMLSVLAGGMCVPALVDWHYGYANWMAFAASAFVSGFLGIGIALSNRVERYRLTMRQAFLMTTLTWLTLAMFASLPFRYGELGMSFTDSFFEAMSGLTTTGSTVIVGLDAAPPGILLWRGILEWIGGIGIVVVAVVILPMLRVGGMQLFRLESSEQGSEKTAPRIVEVATAIGVVYVSFTALIGVAYWAAGMSAFEAIVHAMTTIATGGFSTSDASFAHFDNPLIDAIAICGMLAGGLPFFLYVRTIQGNPRALTHDGQVRFFLLLVAALVAFVTAFLWFGNGIGLSQAFRYAAFNIVSIITGTGYANADYYGWGAFAVPVFFFITFVGGCAGSTSCGIKIFRLQVLAAATRTQVHKLLHPHGVFVPYYNRRPVSQEVLTSVLSFVFIFGFCFSILAFGLGVTGLDFLTAVSGAATAISNVGPALGPIIGPSGTFQPLPDAAKWLLAGGMLLGRLELFTVLVLFSRHFWRN